MVCFSQQSLRILVGILSQEGRSLNLLCKAFNVVYVVYFRFGIFLPLSRGMGCLESSSSDSMNCCRLMEQYDKIKSRTAVDSHAIFAVMDHLTAHWPGRRWERDGPSTKEGELPCIWAFSSPFWTPGSSVPWPSQH